MKKLGIILSAILIFLIGLWLVSVFRINPVPVKDNDQMQKKTYQTQKNEQNEVTVEVTPISLKTEANLEFKVVLDTHSVELNYDLMKIAKLTDDKGRNLKPLSWIGGSGGHHLSGELVFPAISKDVKFLELTIANIAGPDRSFRWDL